MTPALPTESMSDDAAPPTPAFEAPKKHPNYTAVFAAELIELARTDRRIVGITAGMPTGTGLSRFEAEFPDRFFDVGIAEQHAMTFATGLAHRRPASGRRALLDVPPAGVRPDRPRRLPERPAGRHRGRPRRARRRGRDEPPGDVHAARRSASSRISSSPRRGMSRSCARSCGPRSARTTRSPSTTRATPGFGLAPVEPRILPIGRGEVLREGHDLLFVGFGPIVARAIEAADALAAEGWSVGVINARFAKPLDGQLILDGGARQAAGRDVRGERRDRRVRQRRPRARRGGAAHRSGPARRARSGSSASRATGSSTTGPSRTCGACSASTPPGLAEQVRETLAALAGRPGDVRGRAAG